MPVIQETNRINFGSCRMFGTDSSGNVLPYDQLMDLTMDVKTDLKEAYGEGNYAFATADGHKSIDLTAKHYIKNLNSLTQDLGGSAVTTNTTGYVVDEAGTVATHAMTLANTNVIQLLSLIVGVTTNGIIVPTSYAIVTAGSEVAGVSASINKVTGVITFNAAEVNGEPVKATYSYTLGSAAGSSISISNTYQNSAPTFKLLAIKRDLSRIDGSVGIEAWTFNAVRPAGVKNEFKEGDFTVLERSLKAYADPMGNVGTVTFFNK